MAVFVEMVTGIPIRHIAASGGTDGRESGKGGLGR